MNEGHFVEEASNVIYPKLGLETGGALEGDLRILYLSGAILSPECVSLGLP